MTAGENGQVNGVVTLRLIVDLKYNLNGERSDALAARLRRLVDLAFARNVLTGSSDAEVEAMSVNVHARPEPLNLDEIAHVMIVELKNGEPTVADVAERFATYGLMEPDDFVADVRERAKFAQCGSADDEEASS